MYLGTQAAGKRVGVHYKGGGRGEGGDSLGERDGPERMRRALSLGREATWSEATASGISTVAALAPECSASARDARGSGRSWARTSPARPRASGPGPVQRARYEVRVRQHSPGMIAEPPRAVHSFEPRRREVEERSGERPDDISNQARAQSLRGVELQTQQQTVSSVPIENREVQTKRKRAAP